MSLFRWIEAVGFKASLLHASSYSNYIINNIANSTKKKWKRTKIKGKCFFSSFSYFLFLLLFCCCCRCFLKKFLEIYSRRNIRCFAFSQLTCACSNLCLVLSSSWLHIFLYNHQHTVKKWYLSTILIKIMYCLLFLILLSLKFQLWNNFFV